MSSTKLAKKKKKIRKLSKKVQNLQNTIAKLSNELNEIRTPKLKKLVVYCSSLVNHAIINPTYAFHNRIFASPAYSQVGNISLDFTDSHDIKSLILKDYNGNLPTNLPQLEELIIEDSNVIIPDKYTTLKKLIINYEDQYFDIPDTLVNLNYLSLNCFTLLPKKLPKLEIISIKRQKYPTAKYDIGLCYNVTCIPEEYDNLNVIEVNYNLFHKASYDIYYVHNNRDVFMRLYNTLRKMQKNVRFKLFKFRLKQLYNPRYLGGHLAKLRIKF